MTEDNLTDREMLRQLQSQFSQLLEVVSIQYEAGDTASDTVEKTVAQIRVLANNQTNLGKQFEDNRVASRERFDSLEKKIGEASASARDDMSKLAEKWEERWSEGKSTNGHSPLKDIAKEHKARKSLGLKMRENLLTVVILAAFGVGGFGGGIIWFVDFVREPAKLRQDIKNLNDKLDAFIEQQKLKAATPEPKPEPQPEKPRDKKKRPPMPIIPGPGAQNKMTVAKWKDHIANNRTHFPIISGKDFSPRLDAGIQTINPTEERKP